MATKSFDPTKFRNALTKSITGMSSGFNDPDTWISTGNYALNYLVSGDFDKGIPLGKVSVLAGESGCLPEYAVVLAAIDGDPVQPVGVGTLRDAWFAEKEIYIESPDGLLKVVNWFDKGKLPMRRISTATNSTCCAANHLLQRASKQWVPAEKVNVGNKMLTIDGPQEVLRVEDLPEEECYDFEVDHPNHRYWGDNFSSHNSGKSYICSGNIIRDAQRQGIFVVLIDTENALDQDWLEKLDVDTSEDKILKLNMAMIDDVGKTISTFMKDYKETDEEDRPKVLFVIDSLGMLMTPTEVNQFDAGDMKGDMGRKAKALKALVTNCVNMFGAYNVGMIATNHTYASQSLFDNDDVISGGCLTAGHGVQMSDGSIKSIEQINVGDWVKTLDGDNEVAKVFTFDDKEVFEITLETGEKIQATGEHKFLNENNEWKTVAELIEGNSILQKTQQ